MRHSENIHSEYSRSIEMDHHRTMSPNTNSNSGTNRTMTGHRHYQRNFNQYHSTDPVATFEADSKMGVTKMSDNRRSNKPIMEKRRRARINSCLGELKGLILQAMKKDPARHSKLEKADILEMTVKHLQNLQRQQMAFAVSTDPSVITKFRAGFNECATEVASYVGRIDGVDHGVRQRLVGHLRSCITGLNHIPSGQTPNGFIPPSTYHPASDALNILSRTPLTTVRDDVNHNHGTTLKMFAGLHLVPSRLPNGDIAFVLPANQDDRSSASPAMSSSSRSDMSDYLDDDCVASTTSNNRQTPSAFTSVNMITSGVQSTLRTGSVCTVTSSSFSPKQSETQLIGPGPNERIQETKLQTERLTGTSEQQGPSSSNVCSTDSGEKVWRPW